VVGGFVRGRRLGVPPGKGVRPTQDRIREALFSILGDTVEGSIVLDAFAGSGALGIEALSRGAERAVFCDEKHECVHAIRENLRKCELDGRAVVFRTRLPEGLARIREALAEPCDLVFLDPPYGAEGKERILEGLHRFALLKERARIVFEHAQKDAFACVPAGFVVEGERRYGDTLLTFLNYQPGEERETMGGKGKAKIENCVIYPGSFDPITYGHVNIVKRALKIFDRIIVAVAINTTKSGTFSVEERVGMMQEVFKGEPDVEVDSFSGLLVDYVRTRQAQAILRGIRTVTDFDYEFQMALANKSLDPNVEQVYMMTEGKYLYHSSSIIKEIVSLGGAVGEMLPPAVEKKLSEKLKV